MIKRKVITFFIATILSITFILIFVFGEWERPLELIPMIGIYSLLFSPIIFIYGVPITFLSDYITKRFIGIKRGVFALIIHLFFGMVYTFIYGLIFESIDFFTEFRNYWVGEGELNFIAGIVTSFFFWTVDEVLRHIIPKPILK
ncbi:hypothetical protein [Psychrobacillus vulpis]|uniref:Uncharacterized protein n=1 Tax=Psychrobacillus vulpis TaxID=2325572 RepID=A0A544TPP8_9BACI|nr:hypothetical protein [Psychrobacillus vulpis]TQR19431.1 hypothetical protein FG384_12325 [Psychrobacillus vulpis]